MTESVKHTLIAARKLIEKPENWTQGISCRDRNDDWADYRSNQAFKFCLIGAIWRGAETDNCSPVVIAAERALRRVTHEPIHKYNDRPSRKHWQVLRALDRAIEAAS